MFDASRLTRMIRARLHTQLMDKLAAAANGAPSLETEAAKWLTVATYAGPPADSELIANGAWQQFLDLAWKLARSDSGFDPRGENACWWAKAGQWQTLPPASGTALCAEPADANAEERASLRPWIWAWSAASDELFNSLSSRRFNDLIPVSLPPEHRLQILDGLIEALLSGAVAVAAEGRCALFLAIGFLLIDLKAATARQEQLGNLGRLFELVDEQGFPRKVCGESQMQWPYFYGKAATVLGRNGMACPNQCPFVEEWQNAVLDTVPKSGLEETVAQMKSSGDNRGVEAYAHWREHDRLVTNEADPFGPDISLMSQLTGLQPPARPEQEEFKHFLAMRGTAEAVSRAVTLPFAIAGALAGAGTWPAAHD